MEDNTGLLQGCERIQLLFGFGLNGPLAPPPPPCSAEREGEVNVERAVRECTEASQAELEEAKKRAADSEQR